MERKEDVLNCDAFMGKERKKEKKENNIST